MRVKPVGSASILPASIIASSSGQLTPSRAAASPRDRTLTLSSGRSAGRMSLQTGSGVGADAALGFGAPYRVGTDRFVAKRLARLLTGIKDTLPSPAAAPAGHQ